jgi:hypothetical protein
MSEEGNAREGDEVVAEAAGDPDEEERDAMRHLQEEIGKLTVADHVLLMMQSLSSLAVDRMGIAPNTAARKDLAQVRLAIDAFKALLGVLEGQLPAEEIREHRAVLSQLQMAYVGQLRPAPASGGGGGDTP